MRSMRPIIIMSAAITIAINAAVGWAFVNFLPLWVAVPFVVGAAANIFLMAIYIISPERALYISLIINRYVWHAARPVVGNIGILFWEKDAVSGFVELMDTVFDTMPSGFDNKRLELG